MKHNSFWHYLTQKNKLTFKNIKTGEEYWHLFINRIHLVMIVLSILVVIFVAVLGLIVYTPLMDLVPGNPGSKQREMLVKGIEKLDSLEREVVKWEVYNKNLLVILEGGIPNVEQQAEIKRDSTKTTLVQRVDLDSLLRLKHSGDSLIIGDLNKRRQKELTFELMSPASGMIVEKFDPKGINKGILLTPPPSSMIIAVMDGSVILNSWDPQSGSVIAIQHASNLVSIYKQAAKNLKKVGQHVKAGEPIAVSGEIINGEIPKLEFQLWQNGAPVDPENYIAF